MNREEPAPADDCARLPRVASRFCFWRSIRWRAWAETGGANGSRPLFMRS